LEVIFSELLDLSGRLAAKSRLEPRRHEEGNVTTIPAEDMRALVRYPWPGNIQRTAKSHRARGDSVFRHRSRAPVHELEKAAAAAPGPPPAPTGVVTLGSAEREAILRALRRSGGRVSGPRGAAALPGPKRTTLQARMLRLGIPKG
jgi:formate hydrogenlyase transcriptional activator